MSTAVLNRDGTQVGRDNSQYIQIPLKDIIEFFPETEQIIELTDHFFLVAHDDYNIPGASLIFKQIIVDNESILTALSNQEKAQALFIQYKKMLISFLENDPQISNLSGKLVDRFPLEKDVKSLVTNCIEKKIDNWHSCFPLFAVASALGVKIREISFSSNLPSNVVALNDGLTLSAKTNKLFRDLVETRSSDI